MSRTRWVVAGACAVLVATLAVAAPLLPRGDDRGDGAVRPATAPLAEAEIERVLAEGDVRVPPGADVATLVRALVRCANFGAERYCLHLGWTDRSEGAVRRAAVRAATYRAAGSEQTGDLPLAAELRGAAGLPLPERRAAERRELTLAAAAAGKASAVDQRTKTIKDYPRRGVVLDPAEVTEQRRSYWCGPTSMQMIHWGWHHSKRSQGYWADRLGTTTSGTSISSIVEQVNATTGWDRDSRAGPYIVLDVSGWSFRDWMLLQIRHIVDYRAPVVLHPILLKRFYPYLDDDASGHFQVGRGYDKRGDRPTTLGYFEPWNQQRFDPSEPYIARVQWRMAYRSYRANLAHPHQNIGV